MTILFADLRGFTNTSESLGAEKAFVLLNEYLQVMEPAISARHGFISQYQGDGFVALFHRGADSAIAARSVCAGLWPISTKSGQRATKRRCVSASVSTPVS